MLVAVKRLRCDRQVRERKALAHKVVRRNRAEESVDKLDGTSGERELALRRSELSGCEEGFFRLSHRRTHRHAGLNRVVRNVARRAHGLVNLGRELVRESGHFAPSKTHNAIDTNVSSPSRDRVSPERGPCCVECGAIALGEPRREVRRTNCEWDGRRRERVGRPSKSTGCRSRQREGE